MLRRRTWVGLSIILAAALATPLLREKKTEPVKTRAVYIRVLLPELTEKNADYDAALRNNPERAYQQGLDHMVDKNPSLFLIRDDRILFKVANTRLFMDVTEDNADCILYRDGRQVPLKNVGHMNLVKVYSAILSFQERVNLSFIHYLKEQKARERNKL
ncbi:hypothetical protein HN592_04910 [Candidatus Woesearchaeota archaeon]|jgi:hypothetical protein|nr:hypothetical protein [Candidatus Woesearchaeota archaeon]MBT4368553.1 hypothetical protein [Candidatus Woesearchaeota archaeon]MBT4713042.1 hypothetical protein [Candidatus Woesearchaeota archaeon]MBT6639954.1 hypothetical protein [Candidatus Woesearchaeota archaeon]MBT7134126.1 hypothetical protein [Candidatus Woesearchaeota archaeon]